jgi:hypothetical protein
MVRRRAAEAGFKVKLGCHVFRATGIIAYLETGGTLENAQAVAVSRRTRPVYPPREVPGAAIPDSGQASIPMLVNTHSIRGWLGWRILTRCAGSAGRTD